MEDARIRSQYPRLDAVAFFALSWSQKILPQYSNTRSPQKFTMPQLMACAIIKSYFDMTYREVERLIKVSAALQKTLGLSKLPNYKTIQEFVTKRSEEDDRLNIEFMVKQDLKKHTDQQVSMMNILDSVYGEWISGQRAK